MKVDLLGKRVAGSVPIFRPDRVRRWRAAGAPAVLARSGPGSCAALVDFGRLTPTEKSAQATRWLAFQWPRCSARARARLRFSVAFVFCFQMRR